ncbi:MAG: mucoidy inhibitor MuiA family protein [Planctomycetes bacterium]|nr:mucoidy inhibitor MuiA family protein [Planctomycetota bacterium]
MSDRIACSSRITRVVVYARGALVTRVVDLPVGLPTDGAVLAIGGITPLCEPGSLRASADGERRVTGLRAAMVWVAAAPGAAPDHDAQLKLQRQVQRVQLQIQRVQHLRDVVEGSGLNTELTLPSEQDDTLPALDILARTQAALAVAKDFDERIAAWDAALEQLREQEKLLQQQWRDLQPAAQQAAPNTPAREILVSLAPGSDHLRGLTITYSVPAARWWPAYAARLSQGGRQAELSLEAFVAQNTLEDWKDAKLSLCTADMIQEVALPELASLRLGRAQPAKRSGFREPPQGLEALFEGHDRDMAGRTPLGRAAPPPPAPVMAEPSPRDYARAEAPDVLESRSVPANKSAPASAPMASMAQPMPASPARGRAASKDMAKASKKAGHARAADLDEASGMEVAAESASYDDDLGAAAGGGFAGVSQQSISYKEELEHDEQASGPGNWLDFDGLELSQNNLQSRGTLAHRGGAGFDQTYAYTSAIENLDAPAGVRDPQATRGMFDHQFEAEGGVDIPAGGAAHRVSLLSRPAKSRMRLVCVPLADERVFREVELANPLDAPLLPGPVDVFMDGALVITSAVQAVDRGGILRFGLGEEQRVRVARNVRVKEESKGLLGGKTSIDHHVTLEAASSLGGEVEVELIDRVPVSDDKEIEINLTRSEPKGEKYDQADRDSRIRGGLRWKIKLPAGAKAKVEYEYRINLASDHEINGGNRRE